MSTINRRNALRALGGLAVVPVLPKLWQPDHDPHNAPDPDGRIGQRGGWHRVCRFIASYERRALEASNPDDWHEQRYCERLAWQPGVIVFLAVGPPEVCDEYLVAALDEIERANNPIAGCYRTACRHVSAIAYHPNHYWPGGAR